MRLDSAANGCPLTTFPGPGAFPSRALPAPRPPKTALGAPQRGRVEDVEALLARLELCRTELLLRRLRPRGKPRVELRELAGLLQLGRNPKLLRPGLELRSLSHWPGRSRAKSSERCWPALGWSWSSHGGTWRLRNWPRHRLRCRTLRLRCSLTDRLETKLQLRRLRSSCRSTRLFRHRRSHWLWDHLALAVDGLALGVHSDGSSWNGLACGHSKDTGWELGLWDWGGGSTGSGRPLWRHRCRSGRCRNCLWGWNRASSLRNWDGAASLRNEGWW